MHLAHLVGPQALLKNAWVHVLFKGKNNNHMENLEDKIGHLDFLPFATIVLLMCFPASLFSYECF